MKKTIILLIIICCLFPLAFKNNEEKTESVMKESDSEEIRGVYLSYIELSKYFSGKTSWEMEKEIEKIVSNVANNKLNLIILHTRSFSDSIYPSKIFPNNYMITRDEEEKVDFDILKSFINIAHKNNIKVHAWINPFRIRNVANTGDITQLNPSYSWLGTNHVSVIEGKGVYYNPASDEARELILSGIKEIVDNYDIDGIHLDDYFYPSTTIDLENYQEYLNSGGSKSINDYRLDIITNFIKDIKALTDQKNIALGIAPEGNIENNYNTHFLDVKDLLKNNYATYIMPQLYYGFNNQNKPFVKTLNEWNGYIQDDTLLVPALALYKSGEVDNYAGVGKNEWIERDNIIKSQVLASRELDKYKGFILFRYEDLIENNNEVKNLRKILE